MGTRMHSLKLPKSRDAITDASSRSLHYGFIGLCMQWTNMKIKFKKTAGQQNLVNNTKCRSCQIWHNGSNNDKKRVLILLWVLYCGKRSSYRRLGQSKHTHYSFGDDLTSPCGHSMLLFSHAMYNTWALFNSTLIIDHIFFSKYWENKNIFFLKTIFFI